jgi:hypothetical protein
MMIPLSIRMAVIHLSGPLTDSIKHMPLTERIEIERNMRARLHVTSGREAGVHRRLLGCLDSERIQPNADPAPVVAPQGVLECADTSQMDPTEFEPIREDLHVVTNLLARSVLCSTLSEQYNPRYACHEPDSA